MSQVQRHFDTIASDYDAYKQKNWFYYTRLQKLLARLISPNRSVLEVGCGTGDLLEHLQPKYGCGMDISPLMVRVAKAKYPHLKFSTSFPKDKFDYIFMSDVIEHLINPLSIFTKISRLMTKHTVFVCTMANPIWEPALVVAEKLGLKMPEGPHHRWSTRQVVHMLQAAGLRLIDHDYVLLVPVPLPFVTEFANKYLEPFLKPLAFIEYFVATKL